MNIQVTEVKAIQAAALTETVVLKLKLSECRTKTVMGTASTEYDDLC
jgi:hypothetical protein